MPSLTTAASWTIKNAQVADGSGAPLRTADVRISGDTIVEIGAITPSPDDGVVDATGLVLAPGVIDAHNHSTDGLEAEPDAFSQMAQGITTLVVGQDGSSPFPVSDYLAKRRAISRRSMSRCSSATPPSAGRSWATTSAARPPPPRSSAWRPGRSGNAQRRDGLVVGPRIRSGQLRLERGSRVHGACRSETRRLLHLAHPRRGRQIDGGDPRSHRHRREGEDPGPDHAPQARHRRRVGQSQRGGRDDRCRPQAWRGRHRRRLSLPGVVVEFEGAGSRQAVDQSRQRERSAGRCWRRTQCSNHAASEVSAIRWQAP